jgi:hypothetical protein
MGSTDHTEMGREVVRDADLVLRKIKQSMI